jgi:hypothetical protein
MLVAGCGHARPPVFELQRPEPADPASTYQSVVQEIGQEGYSVEDESAIARKIRVRARSGEADPHGPSFITVQVDAKGEVRLVPSGALVKHNGALREESFRSELVGLESHIADRLRVPAAVDCSTSSTSGSCVGQESPPAATAVATAGPLPASPPLGRAAPQRQQPATAIAPPPPAVIFVPAAPQPTAYAVVIGVEKYGDNLPSATGARRDATRFAQMARTSLGVSSDHIQLEVDEQATKASIERSLAWAQESVLPNGRIYFYFSGHGAPDSGRHGADESSGGKDDRDPTAATAFLVPSDGDPKFLQETAIPVREVFATLGRSRAKEVIVFVDACFLGSGPRSVLAPGTRPFVRVKDDRPQAQTAFFSSSRADEVSGPAPDGGGLFSSVLMQGLGNGEADINGDGEVSLSELRQWLPDRVANQARQDNREQHPTLTLGPGASDATILEWGLAPRGSR